jgi:hypothetical protein
VSDDPAAVLRLLFAIPQKQIDRDVAEGEKDFQRLMEDSDTSTIEKTNNPEEEARHHHKQMVRAKVMRSRKSLQEEMKLYFAAMAVHSIAEEAVSVADEQGRLAELGARMDEIQKREGLQDDEFWPLDKGPEDFQQLFSESEELFAKVYDAVFTTMLRRYHLDGILDLYENNREQFEKMWEQGRKMIFENSSEE